MVFIGVFALGGGLKSNRADAPYAAMSRWRPTPSGVGDPARCTFVQHTDAPLTFAPTTVSRYGILRFGLFALMSVSAIGCGEKNSVTAPTDEVGVLRAQIDGIDFLGASELYAQHSNGILAIAARASDGRTIHITLLNQLRPETVNIGKGSVNSAVVALQQAFWRSNIDGGFGTVTVTKVGAFGAQGTFTFTAMAVPNTRATGARTVNGQFNVVYQLTDASVFGANAVQYATLERANRTALF
jgi:hypothetical protein